MTFGLYESTVVFEPASSAAWVSVARKSSSSVPPAAARAWLPDIEGKKRVAPTFPANSTAAPTLALCRKSRRDNLFVLIRHLKLSFQRLRLSRSCRPPEIAYQGIPANNCSSQDRHK